MGSVGVAIERAKIPADWEYDLHVSQGCCCPLNPLQF